MSAELLSTYYAAFNKGDASLMLSLLTDDVEHNPSQGEVRIGKQSFSDFLTHMGRCYKEQVIDPVFMTSADDAHASAEFTLKGTYLQTDGDFPSAQGQRYVLRVGAFFAIRDGKIARVSNHYNLGDWLAQISE